MRKKFTAAFSGIAHAFKHDRGFRIQIIVGSIGLGLATYLGWPLQTNEITLLSLATVLVLITELQNAALERALDRLHPEIHEDIRRSKDMAAGAVLFAAMFAFFVAVTVVI